MTYYFMTNNQKLLEYTTSQKLFEYGKYRVFRTDDGADNPYQLFDYVYMLTLRKLFMDFQMD